MEPVEGQTLDRVTFLHEGRVEFFGSAPRILFSAIFCSRMS
jgi:hypothetical protein